LDKSEVSTDISREHKCAWCLLSRLRCNNICLFRFARFRRPLTNSRAAITAHMTTTNTATIAISQEFSDLLLFDGELCAVVGIPEPDIAEMRRSVGKWPEGAPYTMDIKPVSARHGKGLLRRASGGVGGAKTNWQSAKQYPN